MVSRGHFRWTRRGCRERQYVRMRVIPDEGAPATSRSNRPETPTTTTVSLVVLVEAVSSFATMVWSSSELSRFIATMVWSSSELSRFIPMASATPPATSGLMSILGSMRSITPRRKSAAVGFISSDLAWMPVRIFNVLSKARVRRRRVLSPDSPRQVLGGGPLSSLGRR